MNEESPLFPDDATITRVEGLLPDGRTYSADLWQFPEVNRSYHLTIFVPVLQCETSAQITCIIECALIEFCGPRYCRVEQVVSNDGEPHWSYNIVLCDENEQYVSRMPMPYPSVASFGVWCGDREVTFLPC